MDPVTVGVGVLAIGFGGYTFFLRRTDPSKLKKLKPMQDRWGAQAGLIVHTVAYSLIPVAFGVAMVFAGFSGVSSELAPLPGPPSEYPMAFAERDCGPADGSAVVIYLVNTDLDGDTAPYPHVRISVWRAADTLGGQTYRWSDGENSIGAAVRCPEAGKCQRATSVTLHFRAREPDGAIPGYFDLEFEGGVSIRGGFRAAWRHRPVYCG